MSSSATPSDVPQPPKQATYDQPSNPVDQDPVEQRTAGRTTRSQAAATDSSPSSSFSNNRRQYGDPPAAIHRNPASKPSSDDQLARLEEERVQRRAEEGSRSNDIDTEYGVEQQPTEGHIAAAVEGKNQYNRLQAGAHSGPVGSAQGPGYMGEEPDTAADIGRKRDEHDRILGQSGGKSPRYLGEEDDSTEAERRRVKERKLKEERELDVKGTVGKGTGNVVVS
jgi:hypothetical protein